MYANAKLYPGGEIIVEINGVPTSIQPSDSIYNSVKQLAGIQIMQTIIEYIPTVEELNQARIAEINQELNEIDLKSIRPERSIRVGKGTEYDTQKLEDLDNQATALRFELAELNVELGTASTETEHTAETENTELNSDIITNTENT